MDGIRLEGDLFDSSYLQLQVLWAGFDKGISRQVLLLGYQSGFQVWDVEESDNVHDLVSRHDGPVSFMQMLSKPISSKEAADKFADSRPLLALSADGSLSAVQDTFSTSDGGSTLSSLDTKNGGFIPTVVWIYSLRSQSYIHVLKFRSAVYSVRSSARIVAVAQAAQIHCFGAATLEKEYTILTNPIFTGCSGFGGIGCGPLAVGPRWLAYSGSPVAVSNSGRVSPQHLTPSRSFPVPASNGSLVAHYAKESSKQLAAGILTLGDMGYKKLSRYCSELLPDGSNSAQSGCPGWKVNGVVNGHLPEAESMGMVIVRDIVSKSVVAQFKAHRSPIASLCFDPSGTLLVTASVQGHNINVFCITPGLLRSSSGSVSNLSCVHLYRLQRGFTNAVIQDISFSDDSHWVMISSSRGTSHLFAISPSGGSVNTQVSDDCFAHKNNGSNVMTKTPVRWPTNSDSQMFNPLNICESGPVTLSVVGRIRTGSGGWSSTVTGAAAAAAGRMSSISGAVASAFHNCRGKEFRAGCSSLKAKYHLLVFSPGCLIQYALRAPSGLDSASVVSGLVSYYDSASENDARILVEAIQKWNICQKQSQREYNDNTDIYGENGNSGCHKIFPEVTERENYGFSEARGSVAKVKIGAEERHNLFISEAELQMHQDQIPLWMKPEIYFQSMILDDLKADQGGAFGGEIEIEKFPTSVIEIKSKDLIPVFDYIPTPKFQQARSPASDSSASRSPLHLMSGPAENGMFSGMSNTSFINTMTDGAVSVTELCNGIGETRWEGSHMPPEKSMGFVNNSDSPNSSPWPEIVNSRESSTMEAKLKFVNNDREGPEVENQFKAEPFFYSPGRDLNIVDMVGGGWGVELKCRAVDRKAEIMDCMFV
ncbi:unnamed protein product, partial [Thlaspi arvense]